MAVGPTRFKLSDSVALANRINPRQTCNRAKMADVYRTANMGESPDSTAGRNSGSTAWPFRSCTRLAFSSPLLQVPQIDILGHHMTRHLTIPFWVGTGTREWVTLHAPQRSRQAALQRSWEPGGLNPAVAHVFYEPMPLLVSYPFFGLRPPPTLNPSSCP